MKRHHAIVRVTHWVNVVALTIMVASGLRIFNAHPSFARIGETFCCWPFEGKAIPAGLTFGGWLAGARNWHFAMMWVLVVNGLVYLAFVYLHGEWRDLVPRRGDPRDAWQMAKFYLFLRRDHPRQGKHNALQKLAYFSMPLVAALAVLTGLAIWKPVELSPLTDFFGGYAWARYWHFLAMLAIVALVVGHIFMVFAVDPYSIPAMITGGYDDELSPEARNARPFYHLLPRRHAAALATAVAPAAPMPAVAAPPAVAATSGAAATPTAGSAAVAPPAASDESRGGRADDEAAPPEAASSPEAPRVAAGAQEDLPRTPETEG